MSERQFTVTDEPFEVCVPAVLPPERQLAAARAALERNEENEPDPQTVAELIEATKGTIEHPLALALLTNRKHRNGDTLTVSWMEDSEGVKDKSLRRDILEAMQEWSEHANLYFEGVGLGDHGDVRISLRQTGSSWSHLGTNIFGIPRSEPTMQLGWATRALAIPKLLRVSYHEGGHTLGFDHEHQHKGADLPYDREAVYELYGGPPNNWSREQIERQVLSPPDEPQEGRYDPESVMHYAVPAFLLTDPSRAVGMNNVLSLGDKRQAARRYPKQEAA